MKKLNLIFAVFTLIFSINASGQINQDCNGRIGIGGASSDSRLTLRDGSSLIRFVNGNNHSWVIGNRATSLWGAPNTFDIYDETSSRYLMEFRQDATYLHNRLVVGVGWGNIHRNHFGFAYEAASYDFNPNTSNNDGNYKGFIFENSYNESSGFYCDGDYAVIWSPGDQGYLLKLIDEDGMQLRWYVNDSGTAYTNSDKNRKENIEKINGSLNKIKNISGVTYNFLKTDEEKLKNDSIINGTKEYSGDRNLYKSKIEKKESGFIAQELEEIIPEVVETDENGDKFVNYDGIIPYLVEGMKEQQFIIESLQAEIQELKRSSGSGNQLKSATTSTNVTNVQDNSMNTGSALYKNAPNPFSQNTTIEYSIAENVQKAMICIYDMNGRQIKCIPLNHTGYGNITINGSEFKAGMYMYSLITDGQLIDTKRMVLTD